jgi:L-fucose isomerase-like protein
VTTRKRTTYVDDVKAAFGTGIESIGLGPVLAAYRAVPEDAARAEAEAWTKGALEVREPSAEEVVKSCRLALAFEALLAEHRATAMTVDCYGSMYEPLCKAHAFPCIGFTRLNDRGLAGICESDLECAMTYLLFQGLSGRPSFISDPTMDESSNSIILAHCLGTRKMDGPDGPVSPYRLRTIMERQEGCVPQVFMPVGRRVTQARLIGTTKLPYFTGEVTEAPDVEKGCRTKITVKLDGSATKLWQNYAPGLHRLTCYGDLTKEMGHFARLHGITMIDETA